MKTVTLAAIAAVASQALAEPVPKPYRPVKAFLSAREIFGLEGRDDEGYHPKQSICGAGTTCANSCGDEYEQCPSTDNQMHCYNVKLNESCCTDGTGNSCDAGYYCAADTSSKTWCCPEGMDVDTCASTYQVTGSLTSDAPYVSTTSSSSTSSTLVASTSSTTSSSASTRASSHASSAASSHASSASSGSSPLVTGAVFFETGNSTGAGVAAGSGARVGTGATATVSNQESATSAASADSSATSGVSTSGASSASPATFLALFAAAALAAFF